MKKIFVLPVLAALLMQLLGGCSLGQRQYSATYWDLFDTVTTLTGFAKSQEAFDETVQQLYDQLQGYHRLFDIYREYPGITNLKTVNDMAGIQPVQVEDGIIRLLTDCVEYHRLTQGRVNVAMGSVLALWHQAREQGDYVPDAQSLEAAAAHTDIRCLEIDPEAKTVYLNDPLARLDVGAIAKGWAVQQVALSAPAGMLISVGGNVFATGPKQSAPWIIGVQDPKAPSGYLCKLQLLSGAAVTSGDYQRTYQVDGKAYHHIIDPATRMPSEYWSSVTVVCPDSALADALSTALFVMELEQGKALAQSCGAEVLWVDRAGKQYRTEGFKENW